MRDFFNWLDPHHQGPWFFKWGFWSVLVVVGACCWLFAHAEYQIAPVLLNQAEPTLVYKLMNNIFAYGVNYITHEMIGHNFVGHMGYWLCYNSCRLVGRWWSAAMGNGMETLIPLGLLLASLRISGGRWLLPILWYWLGTTFYSAGTYAVDARACQLPLTSSDMVSNFAPGTMKGDWYHILEPIGLLNYDVLIGRTFIFIGIVCVVIAIYSLYYYWAHTEQYFVGR